MTPLRIAALGLDHWYSAIPFVRAVADRPDLELVAIAHDHLGRARDALGGRAGVEVTTDAASVLAGGGIDAVAVFASPDRAAALSVAAARAGVHILSVKPMAMTLEEASGVRDAVREAGVVFLGHESRPRYTAYQERAREWARAGRFGDLVSAHSTFSAPLPSAWMDTDDSEWFADPARTPFGAWGDHAMYQFDELRWITGAEVTSVSATAERLGPVALPFEDWGFATVRWSNGLTSHQEDSWIAPPRGYRITSGLIGTIGALAFDSAAGSMGIYEDGEWTWSPAPDMDPNGLDGFVGSIRGDIAPRAGVDDAWQNFAACLAFAESVRIGAPVAPVPLPRA